ncbi:hypothetical protein M1O20_02400, partial [Dehalococcoidia bacterium]|nr:hypothetical protein [Dehalococcoidia bacterium]
MSRTRIIALIIGAVIVVSLVALFLGEAIVPLRPRVAVISLTGAIQESDGGLLFPAAAITPELVRGLLEQAERDGSIKAVVLRINSPGGAIAASQEIGDMIKGF